MPRRAWVKPFACPRSPLVQRFRSSNPMRRAQRSGLLRRCAPRNDEPKPVIASRRRSNPAFRGATRAGLRDLATSILPGMEGRLALRSALESILYGMESRNAFAALGPEMTEPNVGVGTAERLHGTDQGKGIPCSVQKIPCSRKKIPCSFKNRELACNALKLRRNSRSCG
jgi:hypothetical protein